MITISKAKIKDCPKIVELEKKIRNEDFVSNVYESAAFIKYGFVFIAKDNEKIIWAIIAFMGKNDIVFVTDFVVDPKYRNYGIWHKLYNKLIKEWKKTIHALVWPDYKESINLHEELWFKLIKKENYPYGSNKKYPMMYLYELKK